MVSIIVESSVAEINHQINGIFASNDVTAEGPGEEAFWNAVEDVQLVNSTAASELTALAGQWCLARAKEGWL